MFFKIKNIFVREKMCFLRYRLILRLYFESAWLSSTINVRSTLYLPCSGLCSQDFGLPLCRLADRYHKRHCKVAANTALLGSSAYFIETNLCVAGTFRVGHIQHTVYLYSALDFEKGFHSVHFTFSQQSQKRGSVRTLRTQGSHPEQREQLLLVGPTC